MVLILIYMAVLVKKIRIINWLHMSALSLSCILVDCGGNWRAYTVRYFAHPTIALWSFNMNHLCNRHLIWDRCLNCLSASFIIVSLRDSKLGHCSINIVSRHTPRIFLTRMVAVRGGFCPCIQRYCGIIRVLKSYNSHFGSLGRPRMLLLLSQSHHVLLILIRLIINRIEWIWRIGACRSRSATLLNLRYGWVLGIPLLRLPTILASCNLLLSLM